MISVIAGVNGSGKSSVIGSTIRALDGSYFNPDEEARRLLEANPGMTEQDANFKAWKAGVEMLKLAVEFEDDSLTFETTLGGNTITDLLLKGAENGKEISIIYVGLESPELHIERVKARVGNGGHDIPESKIRDRCHSSMVNILKLVPFCTNLILVDNSLPQTDDGMPQPLNVLVIENRELIELADERDVPDWAIPIVAAAITPFIKEP